MNDKQLPNNDPDLKLSQAIGRALAEDTALSKLTDSLLPPLLKYRKRVRRRHRGNSSGKQKVWQQIDSETAPAEKETAVRKLFNARSFRWAAAAVVLIGALFSLYYLQFRQQPELLAQAGRSIEIVHLKDGSTVTLRAHSKLFEIEQSPSILLYKLKGEALFEVTSKQHRTFSVITKNGRVSVLGTRFILSSWGNRMQVFLDEGLVKVLPAQEEKTIILHPGDAVSIIGDGHINRMPNASAGEFTDWLHNQLIFNSKPVEQVVRELEQQFNVSISLPEKIADNRLSGQLSLQSLQVSLADLGLVLGGTFVRIGERRYRFKAR